VAGILRRAVAIYRRGGLGGLLARAKKKVQAGTGELAYQEKLAYGLVERLAQIDRALPHGSRSALDIGCNLGDIAAHCARRGLWTIGVDRSKELIDEAQRRHSGLADCGFLLMDVKPDDVQRLPSFDVVFLLSVHHHWLRAYGPEQTRDMLRGLAEKTGSAMIFEAPSRRVRYGDHAPDFVDNDEVSVNVYLRSYLTETLADLFSTIEPLGKAPCVGDREPYRWSYVLHR
jgi:SAM-dependent methyltransferase